MKYKNITKAIFIKRPNRFIAEVDETGLYQSSTGIKCSMEREQSMFVLLVRYIEKNELLFVPFLFKKKIYFRYTLQRINWCYNQGINL